MPENKLNEEQQELLDFMTGNHPMSKHNIQDQNIIKKTCKELGITQRELGEIIHTSETSVYKWTSSNNPPAWAIKMFELLIKEKEFEELKEKLRNLN